MSYYHLLSCYHCPPNQLPNLRFLLFHPNLLQDLFHPNILFHPNWHLPIIHRKTKKKTVISGGEPCGHTAGECKTENTTICEQVGWVFSTGIKPNSTDGKKFIDATFSSKGNNLCVGDRNKAEAIGWSDVKDCPGFFFYNCIFTVQ